MRGIELCIGFLRSVQFFRWSWFFAWHKGSDDFIAVHKFETERRLVKTKESEISYRPRGLANNVESQRLLRVESPIGRAAGREESVRSIS